MDPTSFSTAAGRPPLNRGISDEVNLHFFPELIQVRRQPERLAPFDGGQRSFSDGLGRVGMRTNHHGLAGERSTCLSLNLTITLGASAPALLTPAGGFQHP